MAIGATGAVTGRSDSGILLRPAPIPRGAAVLVALVLGLLVLLEARLGGTVPVAAIVSGLAVFAALCLVQLEAAFILILAAVPLSLETSIGRTGAALQMPTEPMLLLALVAWGLRFLARGSTTFRHPMFMAILLAALATCLISIIDAGHRLVAIKATLNAVWYALFGIFLMNNLKSRALLKSVVVALLIPGTAITLMSLAFVASGQFDVWAGYWRAGPFFTEHGSFAAYLSFVCALSLALMIESGGAAKLLFAAVAFLTGAQIVLTLTRGAWLGLGVLLIFLVVVSGRRLLRPANTALGILGLAMAAVAVLSFGSLKHIEKHGETITDSGYQSNTERLNRWYAGYSMFRSDPFTGVGFGTYPENYLNFRRLSLATDESSKRMGIHSEYLRVLAETGLFGFLAAALATIMTARIARRAVQRARDPLLRALAVGMTGGLITYMVHGFVNNFMAYDKVAIPVWTCIGVLGAIDLLNET